MPDNRTIVWDFPTRVFHWALVAFVALAWISAEADGVFFWLHVVFGEIVIALVVFRLIWGFIGGRYARFADFVRGPGAVKAHLASLLTRTPQQHIGHNPAAGWMILVLLLVAFFTSFTGLFLIEPPYIGPYAHYGNLNDDLHEGLAEILPALVGLHVLAVLLMSLLMGENLTRAMWTGKKSTVAEAPPSDGGQALSGGGQALSGGGIAPEGSRGRAVLAVVIAVFAALWPFL